MGYIGNIYRPPSEANSFILQCTVGCSHNACTFCGMFKDKKYYVKDMAEIIQDIDAAAAAMPGITEVFLADGDAIAMPQDDLLEIIGQLKRRFLRLESIATYAGPKSTLSKSAQELRQLHEAGLTRAYLGVESGSDQILRDTCKGVSAQEMERAGKNLVEAGISLWTIVLIGLGGAERSEENARETAAIINSIKPAQLAAMTYTPVPGTRMYTQIQKGEFCPLDTRGALQETRALIAGLDVDGLYFASDHVSNAISARCVLPKDKDALLRALDGAIVQTPQGAARRANYL
jgi:radical SAM superfamily enzyme YgiQ (UPF0313 family)